MRVYIIALDVNLLVLQIIILYRSYTGFETQLLILKPGGTINKISDGTQFRFWQREKWNYFFVSVLYTPLTCCNSHINIYTNLAVRPNIIYLKIGETTLRCKFHIIESCAVYVLCTLTSLLNRQHC